MHNKLNEFLDNVCSHIKFKSIHTDVRNELTHHVEDLKSEYVSQGQDEEVALNSALLSMGDSTEIGNRLNAIHKPKTEWSLITLTAIMVLFGGIVMYMCSKFESRQAINFDSYLAFVGIGIALLVGLYFFDYTKLKKFSWLIYILGFTSIVLMSNFTSINNNNHRFIIDNFFMSCDLALLLFLVAFAGFVENFRGKGGLSIVPLILVGAISVVPIGLTKLSLALLLIIGYGIILLSAVYKNHFGGNRKLQFISLFATAATGVLFISTILFSGAYRAERFMAFMSRGRDYPRGRGFQMVMADNWLSVSQLFGKTTQTVLGGTIEYTLPGISSELIIINIIANFGWVVGLGLIAVVAFFIFRMIRTTSKIKYDYGFFLATGICAVLSAQLIISILINFGFFPLTGLALPFISYSRENYILSMAFVGLILSVWRRNNLVASNSKTKTDAPEKFIQYEDGKLIITLK